MARCTQVTPPIRANEVTELQIGKVNIGKTASKLPVSRCRLGRPTIEKQLDMSYHLLRDSHSR